MVHRWPHHPPATPHRTLHPHQPSDADAAESITHRRASASPSYTTPRTAAVPMSAAPRVRRPSSTAGTLVKPLAASIHPKPSPPSAPSTTSRYSHVHSTLNTGPNASNTHRPSPYRTADPFPRLSPTTLAALIRAHSDAEESVYALTARRTLPPHPRDEDGVSAIGSVGGEGGVEGGGRGVGLVVGTMDAPSYLLLDVREAGEFAAGHIVGAVSFPAVLVRRDQYPSILVQFRSAPNRVVVVYDSNDVLSTPRRAAEVATHLIDRGYTDVRVLTGGIERWYTQFPELCTGHVAVRAEVKEDNKSRRGSDTARSTTRSAASTPR